MSRSGNNETQNAVVEVISEIFLDKCSLTSQLYSPLYEYGQSSDQSMHMECSYAVLESNWYLPFPGWNTKLADFAYQLETSFALLQGPRSKNLSSLLRRIYLILG